MASTKLYTFQDAVEHLWLMMNPATKPPTGRELRLAKMAVVNTYRELPNIHRWEYYKRRQLIQTEAYYVTGTITYDHTGGSSERLVTLADGTWPDNAAYGTIEISDVHYPVASRLSDTTITLDVNNNPGSDVDAGTSYVWYRDAYPLPVNFRRLGEIMDSSNPTGLFPLEYVSPDDLLVRTRMYNGQTVSQPLWYTIRNDNRFIGSLSIIFGRPPNSARTYDCMYEISPRELKTYLQSTGTVSCTAAATTVTGSGTAFSDVHVGSIIRVPASGTGLPTSVVGTVDGTDNPYWAQKVVTAVASATSLTIDSAFSAATSISGVGFTISDPIDIEVDAMLPYFIREIEAEYARLGKRDDADKLANRAQRALLHSMSNDIRSRKVESGMFNDGNSHGAVWGTVTGVPS